MTFNGNKNENDKQDLLANEQTVKQISKQIVLLSTTRFCHSKDTIHIYKLNLSLNLLDYSTANIWGSKNLPQVAMAQF